MHKWFEDVLAYGFAFGHGGDKVQGKRLIASFTSGTPADTYVEGGLQRMTLCSQTFKTAQISDFSIFLNICGNVLKPEKKLSM